MQVAPRSVLITGANRGIGLEMVRQLLSLPTPPTHLFATCRNPDDAKDLHEIASSNSAVKVVKFDVSKEEMIPSLYDTVAEAVEGEGLNMLIHNAATIFKSRKTLDTVTAEDMMDIFQTNTVAPLMITKAFLPLLRQAAGKVQGSNLSYSRASVVNISSRVGSMSDNRSGGSYAYRTSKAGLNMVTSCLAIDLTPEGILVVAVHPGWVKTEMGGPNALITTEKSVSSLFKFFATASEEHAGKFYDFTGVQFEW